MIKSTIGPTVAGRPRTYPYLAKSGDRVILFVKPDTGVTIADEHEENVGKLYDGWNEKAFTVLEESVTLSNV